ncbi:MAG: helix-turn-helix transcriptional regulator [Actinotalea sp.]|nr:helix-turn-helix transcriptional regulator [Actinotalea sp.]
MADDGKGSPAPVPGPLGPEALKAYAHPLRVRIIRHLNDHGAATATTLAAALGESTGQTSYHLRQLERHGLVEEDTARGTGRERWWRSRSIEIGPDLLEDPTTAPAMRFLFDRMIDDRAATLRRLLARERLPEQWRDTLTSEATLRIDGDEMTELNAALQAALEPFVERSRARRDDPRWRARPRVRVYIDSFPLLDD